MMHWPTFRWRRLLKALLLLIVILATLRLSVGWWAQRRLHAIAEDGAAEFRAETQGRTMLRLPPATESALVAGDCWTTVTQAAQGISRDLYPALRTVMTSSTTEEERASARSVAAAHSNEVAALVEALRCDRAEEIWLADRSFMQAINPIALQAASGLLVSDGLRLEGIDANSEAMDRYLQSLKLAAILGTGNLLHVSLGLQAEKIAEERLLAMSHGALVVPGRWQTLAAHLRDLALHLPRVAMGIRMERLMQHRQVVAIYERPAETFGAMTPDTPAAPWLLMLTCYNAWVAYTHPPAYALWRQAEDAAAANDLPRLRGLGQQAASRSFWSHFPPPELFARLLTSEQKNRERRGQLMRL